MEWLKHDERLYLQSVPMTECGGIVHGFTCKSGGVSTGKITGLNLGFRVEDDPASVLENYRLVAEDLGFPMESAVLARQTHTDNIRLVTKADAGKGLVRESDIFDTDGLMTEEKGIPLVVFTADCVPILLYDPRHPAVAAIHAGWRGTEQKIGGKAVRMMQERFGSKPEDILVAIGPSIGLCHFAFGEDAPEHFSMEFCKPNPAGGYWVDLWAMNKKQLLSQGILEEHIDIAEICTVCHEDVFYSYRTHREHTGRQAAIIILK
ncbi:MAG: peptidoglycan editing factor PgeF [Clostridia bacterium]|nr:peptidoglycan editing factor PgeF [Clostridia bacterium]